MKIQAIYDKHIERRINPAVVVSEKDQESIKQEIEEYIFTPVITKNTYKFLDAIANKSDGKTGVWINGYYGSGKSHFIKYLSYIFDPEHQDQAYSIFTESVDAIDPLEEPNQAKVATLKNKINKLTIDQILFNIDAVSDQKNAKDRITRVLLNQINKFRGYNPYNIALALYLEKSLDQLGLFKTFQERVKNELEATWKGNEHRFIKKSLGKVLEIAHDLDPNFDPESLRASIQDKNQDYSITFLIDELKDFLSEKDENYRLLFLMDEVSQYIGNQSDLLLNLQTIVEEVGSEIGTRVWIVCTAQQDLQSLVDVVGNDTQAFGKILARFETKISLESQDAAFITKKRVLQKSADGIKELNHYYKNHKGAIENQFVFDHDLYHNYQESDEFILTYPFVPYQFKLISDVFESFSQVGYVGEGVRNTERAILGITHYTAKLCKEEEVGYFVPFDLFFNDQLKENLTHHARGILDGAYSLERIQSDPFAQRVVNALFMISNLGESKSINFPANIENIALLLMTAAETPKQEMQNRVGQVLDLLVSQNIIQVSEGKYRFLKEDEIEVAQLIKNTTVTNEDRLTYIYEDILQKILSPNPYFNYGNNKFRIEIHIDDKIIGANGDFVLKFSVFDTTEIQHLAHTTPTQNMIIAISDWLKGDDALKNKILDYVRTQKYIRLNSAGAVGTRSQTLINFRETNKLLLEEIRERFRAKYLETALISNQQVVGADEFGSSVPEKRLQEMVERHMEEVYRKHKLSNSYATNNQELLTKAKNKQTQLNKGLSPVEEELNNKIQLMGDSPVVGDIVKDLEKPPYGWKDVSTLDILLSIAQKGFRRFEWRNEEINGSTFAEKALNSRERNAITVHSEKVYDQEELQSFIQAVNHNIFNENLIDDQIHDYKLAVEEFKTALKEKLALLHQHKEYFEAYPFVIHLRNYHKLLADLYETRNEEQVVQKVINQAEDMRSARDRFMHIEEFIEYNISDFDQIKNFVKQHKSNFPSLDDLDQESARDLIDFMDNNREPWEQFPEMKQRYKELKKAIDGRVKKLRVEVLSNYESIFKEIDERREAINIDSPHLTADSGAYLDKIRSSNQITRLENYLLEANPFRARNLKSLEEHKAKTEAEASGKDYVESLGVNIVQEMSPTAIENEEQLDEYLKKLKAKIMVKLNKNQKIWLS